MDHYKSSLIRRLKVRSKEVLSELKEVKSIYELAVSGFCISLDSYCKEKGVDNPLESIDKEEKEEKQELNQSFKKLFRKISILTHPDKTQNDDSRETLEDAVKAKKTQDAGGLTSIAQDLKIDLSNLDYDSIEFLERSIAKSEQEINNIHNSYPWLWYYSSSNKKEVILVSFIQNYV